MSEKTLPARTPDPFANFKAAQREAWSSFAPFETFTAIPAAKLVKFAQINAGQSVLDVACGTGVVAVTAARLGAKAAELDLSPALIERARYNATVAQVDVEFLEGDVEAMPYLDGSFDVVLSQYEHMFAPRPSIALQEMLRVLKISGRSRSQPGLQNFSLRDNSRSLHAICRPHLMERMWRSTGFVGRSQYHSPAAWRSGNQHSFRAGYDDCAFAQHPILPWPGDGPVATQPGKIRSATPGDGNAAEIPVRRSRRPSTSCRS
jgi:SAM-dependent methyltransferase